MIYDETEIERIARVAGKSILFVCIQACLRISIHITGRPSCQNPCSRLAPVRMQQKRCLALKRAG